MNMKLLNFTAALILVVLVFYLLQVGQALLLPLVIAITLWYLINTLAHTFGRVAGAGIKLPRPLCLAAAILTFLLVIWSLITFFSARVDEVREVLPTYQTNLTIRLENLQASLGGWLEMLPFMDMSAVEERGITQIIIDRIDLPGYGESLALSFGNIVGSSVLILIYILFLFLEQGYFTQKISALTVKGSQEEEVRQIINQIRNDIRKYISIKMFTSALTGTLSYLFLLSAGVDFPGVWGLIIFLLNFIPTVGSIVATIFPAMIALAQSDGYTLLLLVLLGIGTLQICIGNILEPRLMGRSFNLSPIVILLNLVLWGYIWGIPGMFLCVPFLIIITIVLSHFPRTRPIAIMLSSDGNLQ